MKTLRALITLAVFAATTCVSAATDETTAPAAAAVAQQAGFVQKPGAQVPLDAVFRDAKGAPMTLRALLAQTQRPAVLVLGYKECPMLCSQVLGSLVETLNDLRLTTGKDFDVIDVSIDPHETSTEAGAQERIYFKRYLRPGAEIGWHFLVSPNENSVRQLADAVGFRYAYDPVTKQYAHPAGLIVLTKAGRVSQYLFGVNFDPAVLRTALVAAGGNQIGSPIEQIFLLCFHYNPIAGKYGAIIMTVMRTGGVLTLLALGGLFVWLLRGTPRAAV